MLRWHKKSWLVSQSLMFLPALLLIRVTIKLLPSNLQLWQFSSRERRHFWQDCLAVKMRLCVSPSPPGGGLPNCYKPCQCSDQLLITSLSGQHYQASSSQYLLSGSAGTKYQPSALRSLCPCSTWWRSPDWAFINSFTIWCWWGLKILDKNTLDCIVCNFYCDEFA